ncbi:MAG: TonB-dependent receptor [Candidatus Delongbacteria bacterium]|nr:TonB-dependent receptor [Candidatus Delongbacteria bacterium]
MPVLLIRMEAQNAGKIAGRVTDAETGEPLIGVNVMVEGSQKGAATDEKGEYVILNVQPGIHTLKFLFIGYKPLNVSNLQIKIDRTSTINVRLQSTALQIGQGDPIVITAEKPIVEADKTSSSIHIDAREMSSLPVEGLRNVLELSANTQRTADGKLEIRGNDDIKVIQNGMGVVRPNDGQPAYGTSTKSETSWKYDINPLAVSQMEVISGGFNAEYGNAQSGVVKVVTKEGSEKFSAAFVIEYRPPGKYHWGENVYSQNQTEWKKWGNIENWYSQSQFYNDSLGRVDSARVIRNYNLWVTNHTPSDDNIFGVYDYTRDPYTRYLFSLSGPLGRNPNKLTFFASGELKNKPTRLPTREKTQRLQNYLFVLAFKPNASHSFKLTTMIQSFYSGMGSGSDDIRWAGLWDSYGAKRKYTLIYDSPREETVYAQSLTYKYLFSSKSFLEAIMTHQNEVLYALQTPTPATATDIKNPVELRQIEEDGPWFEKFRTYYTWSSIYNQASVTDFWEGKLSFSSQVTHTNLFKMGMETFLMDQDYNASSSLCVAAFLSRNGYAANYKAKTWYAAGYLQDKLEFAGMVANIGVRSDAYNFGADVPSDPYNLFYPATGSTGNGIPQWENSKTYLSLSPRFGISFPIAERTAFRIQYGHFRSMPSVNRALDNQTNYGWGSYGNPNLKPPLSINYEVGVQQNLWNTHQLDIVTYYNDLKDQVSTIYIRSSTGNQNRSDDFKGSYISYSNQGHGNSRGVEVTFANRNSRSWLYRCSFSLSQTNYGNYGVYLDMDDITPELIQKYQYSASDYLASEDRTFRFNASLTYILGKNEGPKLWGRSILSETSFGLVYRVSSGLPYYWSPEYQYDYQVENNRRYPMEATTDFRLEKSHAFGPYTLKFSLRVLNLFDNQHLTPITNSEELNRWVLRSMTYCDPDHDPTRDVYLYNYFQTFKNIPRQFFFSLGVSF